VILRFADFGVEPGFSREELAQERGSPYLGRAGKQGNAASVSQDKMKATKVELDAMGRASYRQTCHQTGSLI